MSALLLLLCVLCFWDLIVLTIARIAVIGALGLWLALVAVGVLWGYSVLFG